MKFTDLVPEFTNEQIQLYQAQGSGSGLFDVEKCYNHQNGQEAMAVSLFKPDHLGPGLFGDAWWNKYWHPFLDAIKSTRSRGIECDIRIYLSPNLQHKRDELLAADPLNGTAIHQMARDSKGLGHGSMWRFLALDSPGRSIWLRDADSFHPDEHEIMLWNIFREQQHRMKGPNEGRVLRWIWGEEFFGSNRKEYVYRPMHAAGFAATTFETDTLFSVKEAMCAYCWHGQQGLLNLMCYHPRWGNLNLLGSKWADYGFDECFINSYFYHKYVKLQRLGTIVGTGPHYSMHQDLAYVLENNPEPFISTKFKDPGVSII